MGQIAEVKDVDGNVVGTREVQPINIELGSLEGQNASVVVKAHEAAARELSKVMVARAVPRSMEDIEKLLLGSNGLCSDVIFAEKAIYLKPTSKILIEGLSKFFATYLASIYGNLMVETIEHGKNRAESQVQCVVWDQERNYTRTETIVVLHKKYTTAGGLQDIYAPDDIRLAVSREKSFLERNVLLDVFPPDLTQRCFEKLIQTLDRSASQAVQKPVETMQAYANKWGVGAEKIMKFLNISKVDQFKPVHVRRLIAMDRAFTEETTTVKKVFASMAIDVEELNEAESKEEAAQDTKKAARASKPKSEQKPAESEQTPAPDEQKAAESEQKAPAAEQSGKPADSAEPPKQKEKEKSGSAKTASPEKSKETAGPPTEATKPAPAPLQSVTLEDNF